MTHEERTAIKVLINQKVRQRIEAGYLDCDPESLTLRAQDAEVLGNAELANALRSFRDKVVNPLLGMGWSFSRIEIAVKNHWKI